MTTALDEMLAKVRDYRMDQWERRAQKISWAVGQVRCMRDGEKQDEWMQRLWAAKDLELDGWRVVSNV